MKRMMSIAAVALFMAGASAFACDTCGCKDKKADKAACCTAEKKCSACTAEKACDACAKKAEAKKAAAKK
jgi:hypothetical protein